MKIFFKQSKRTNLVHFIDISNTSHIYVCTGCKSYYLQPLAKLKENNSYVPMVGPIVNSNCEHCGNKFHVII